MSKPGLAFIPYYNKVLLGKISGKEKLGKVLFGLELVTVLCNVASYFGDYINIYLLRCCGILLIVTLIAIFVINIYMAHRLMNRVTFKFSPLLTVVNVLTVGFTRSIILFTMKNNDKILKDNN